MIRYWITLSLRPKKKLFNRKSKYKRRKSLFRLLKLSNSAYNNNIQNLLK
jgi:hypothetical protein